MHRACPHRWVALAAMLLYLPRAAPAQDSLVVVGPDGTTVLTATDFRTMPRDTATVTFHGNEAERYAGVPLHSVLLAAGLRADSIRGAAVRSRIVLEAADGYAVVLSLAEADPGVPDRRLLLADALNGSPLPESEAPFRLIIVGDSRHSRWIRQVTRIRIASEP